MAQGVANFVAPFFGGMPATGTIARTVTNVRAGAHLAGGRHRACGRRCWWWCWLAAPLALHVPLAVLAGILLFVAWNMGEWHEFARLRQFSAALPHDAARHLLADRGVRPDGGGAGRAGAGLRVLHLPHEHAVQRAAAAPARAPCRTACRCSSCSARCSSARSARSRRCRRRSHDRHARRGAGDAPPDLDGHLGAGRAAAAAPRAEGARRRRWCWPTSTSSRCR